MVEADLIAAVADVLARAGLEEPALGTDALRLVGDGDGVLVGWQPDDLLRPSRDLHQDAHLPSGELDGLHRAFGMALTAVLTGAGFVVQPHPAGWLRVTWPGAGCGGPRGGSGGGEGDDGGDVAGGGQEALSAGHGDAVAQHGWRSAGEDDPGP